MPTPVPTHDDSAPPDDKEDIEAWVEQTKAIERVITVALTLGRPRPVSWIAEEACVAEQTARDHLELLGGLGVVASTSAHGVTKYHCDEAYVRFREVAGVVERYDQDKILDTIQSLRERDEAATEEYEADGPEELRDRAADAESSEEIKMLRQAASEWESLRHRLSLFQRAHREYDAHQGTGSEAEA